MTEANVAEPAAIEPVLYKFTNKAESQYLDSLLTMFYEGAFRNHIGIMEAWNLETEQEDLILVGIQLDEEGKPDCFPIAKCLRAEDVSNYLAPTGKGGYFDPADPTEVAEYKEGLNALSEETVQ